MTFRIDEDVFEHTIVGVDVLVWIIICNLIKTMFHSKK